jgi:hypothetical protein
MCREGKENVTSGPAFGAAHNRHFVGFHDGAADPHVSGAPWIFTGDVEAAGHGIAIARWDQL